MSNFSNNSKKMIISVWGSMFEIKLHVTWITNKVNVNCRFPSVFPSGFRINDIASISGTNVLKNKIDLTFHTLKLTRNQKSIGRHISSGRSSTANGVYIPVEKVTASCFQIEAFTLHGLLNA